MKVVDVLRLARLELPNGGTESAARTYESPCTRATPIGYVIPDIRGVGHWATLTPIAGTRNRPAHARRTFPNTGAVRRRDRLWFATCLEAGCRREQFGVGSEDRPGQQGILGCPRGNPRGRQLSRGTLLLPALQAPWDRVARRRARSRAHAARADRLRASKIGHDKRSCRLSRW
jgi:hypothetical protein